jgi:NAD binding domain of 6-phosphogluconate dehydrogenase
MGNGTLGSFCKTTRMARMIKFTTNTSGTEPDGTAPAKPISKARSAVPKGFVKCARRGSWTMLGTNNPARLRPMPSQHHMMICGQVNNQGGSMQSIGFVGVGNIGTEIAKHLLAAGYEVLGYRRNSLAELQRSAAHRRSRQPQSAREQTSFSRACRGAGILSMRRSTAHAGWCRPQERARLHAGHLLPTIQGGKQT